MNSDDTDDEDVRLRAYYLWEQQGRPDSDPNEFWHKAREIHRGVQLQNSGAAEVDDPHPPEEGDPYGAKTQGAAGSVAG